MLHFRLFGVPVAIHPSVWIVLAILGGGLHVNNAAGLLPIGLFVIAGFISLLAHEFGHALVGKWLCGNQVSIELAYMGGACHFDHRVSRGKEALRALAGPVASLLVGCVFVWLLSFYLYDPSGLWQVVWSILTVSNDSIVLNADMPISHEFLYFIQASILVAGWWSAFNLLPVFPMDGGHVLNSLTGSYRVTSVVGLLVGGGLALFLLSCGLIFAALILGYFAFINLRILQSLPR